MSHLTIEKMDKINFLITEVSLECLGNKFFDIYGKQNKSLLGLISVNTLKRDRTTDTESDLWTSLTTEKKPTIQKRIHINVKSDVVDEEPRRKRRASFSTTNNELDTSNDPEELLVPMTIAPKAAKIAQRRSTISVQQPAKNRKPTTVTAHKIRKSDQSLLNPKQVTPKPYSAKIAEVKQNLKRDINIRKLFFFFFLTNPNERKKWRHGISWNLSVYFDLRLYLGNNAMRLLSESQEQKYREIKDANIDDFYKAEEKSLFSQCNTLIQFIKFIQENGDNPTKLSHISQAILELQKEYWTYCDFYSVF